MSRMVAKKNLELCKIMQKKTTNFANKNVGHQDILKAKLIAEICQEFC